MVSYLFASVLAEEWDGKALHYIVDAFDIPIDTDEQDTHRYGEHTEMMLLNNLGSLSRYVKPVRSKSLDWLAVDTIIKNEFDTVFIDGDHRDPILYLELCLAENSVKHILGHDYGWGGVTKSVDRFAKQRGYKIIQPLSGRGVFELEKI